MVNDPVTDELIRWSDDGDSFFVPSADRFGRELLPRFFKHSNFGSFVRQLNMYGFHKVPHLQQGVLKNDSEEANELLEFSNPNFTRAQPDLLCLIRRQKARTDTATLDPSTSTALDLPMLLTDLVAIRKHQTALSADLKDLQTSNHALWQEALQSRERHTRHQETINKILRFLATVFGAQVTGSDMGDGEEGRQGANVVVEEDGVDGEGSGDKGQGQSNGNGKGKEPVRAVVPKLRSRLLLEDVKGRKEARDKLRREEEADRMQEEEDEEEEDEEIEEIPLPRTAPIVSRAGQYASRPNLARSGSNSGSYSFNGHSSPDKAIAPSPNSSRFETIPSNSNSAANSPASDNPTPAADHQPQHQQQQQAGLPPDMLSSLLSPSNSNTLAAFLQLQNGGGLNTVSPAATTSTTAPYPKPTPQDHLSALFSGGTGDQAYNQRALLLPPALPALSANPLDPLKPSGADSAVSPASVQNTLASLLPSYSPDPLFSDGYTEALADQQAMTSDFVKEKARIDAQEAALSSAIANLMQNLPQETRDQLIGQEGTQGEGAKSAGADGGMQWGDLDGPDLDLNKFLAQYVNSNGTPAALPNQDSTDYSYLYDHNPALGANPSGTFETLSPSDSQRGFGSQGGSGASDGGSTFGEGSTIDGEGDDGDGDYEAVSMKRGKKRKSEGMQDVASSAGRGGTRTSSRNKAG